MGSFVFDFNLFSKYCFMDIIPTKERLTMAKYHHNCREHRIFFQG